MSSVQYSSYGYQAGNVGTAVLTVVDPASEVTDVNFMLVDGTGVETGPFPASRIVASGVYERDIPLHATNQTRIRPVVTTTVGTEYPDEVVFNPGSASTFPDGLDIGAYGQIRVADGASSAADARWLFRNGTDTHAALRLIANDSNSFSVDAVQANNSSTTKTLLIQSAGGETRFGGLVASKKGAVATTDEHFQFGKAGSPASGNPYYTLKTSNDSSPAALFQSFDGSAVFTFLKAYHNEPKLVLGDAATTVEIVESLRFAPSSGATKNTSLFQSGDQFFIADQGVGNLWSIPLGTGHLISYKSALGAPTFNTLSVGARMVLWPHDMSVSDASHSIGVDTGAMWYGVGKTTNIHKWYGGTTEWMRLNGSLTLFNGLFVSKKGTAASSADEHFQFGKGGSPAANNPYFVWKTTSAAVPAAVLEGWDGSVARTFITADYQAATLSIGTTLSWGGGSAIASSSDVPQRNQAETITGNWKFVVPVSTGIEFENTLGVDKDSVRIDVDSATPALYAMTRSETKRWRFGMDAGEAGSNTGGNFGFHCYDDSGSFVRTAVFMQRSTGHVGVAAPPSVASSFLPNSSVSFSIDESGNKLMFAVKYSGGTVKSGSVNLT